MLDSARSLGFTIPRIPVQALISAGTLTSFAWLLLQNKIHPVFVYLLQIYLKF